MAAEVSKPRKEEILDVAARLFAERGYEGASMNDVAECVGMRKASLFYHFATKDALYEAVLDRLVASLQQPLEAIYASSGTFAERLDALTRTLTEALGTRPHAARLLLREAMDWGPVMRGKLYERILIVLESGAAWVREGQQQGAFCEGDPRHLVLTSVGMHLLPFAIEQFVERFMGTGPFDPKFIEARCAEVERQSRNLHMKR